MTGGGRLGGDAAGGRWRIDGQLGGGIIAAVVRQSLGRAGAAEKMRYDLLAVNLAATAMAVVILCFYGFISLLTIMAFYVLTSSTPFDIDFPVQFLYAGPIGVAMAVLCAASGMLGALICAIRLRIIGWVVTGITVAMFMIMVASPLLFAAFI